MPMSVSTENNIGTVLDILCDLLDSMNDSRTSFYIADAIEATTDVMKRSSSNPPPPDLKQRYRFLGEKLARLDQVLTSGTEVVPIVAELRRRTEDLRTATQSP
jgi:hypothetical protein